jgi:succinyl-CoA synthetase beta subunit
MQSFRANTPEDALAIAQRVMAATTKTKPFVDIIVKAQIHAGGRGKGVFKESGLKGGVQTATKPSEVHDYTEKMLGKTLVTPQTGQAGRKVNEVFLVEKAFLRKELYISFLLDRSSGSIALVTSSKGGMNIEEVEHSKVHKFFFPPGDKIPSRTVEEASESF